MSENEIKTFFESRRIDVAHIPLDVQKKAAKIIQQIEGGTPLFMLGIQRMKWDKTISSIAIGFKWRLVLRDREARKLLSHEDYNRIAHNKGSV